MRAALAAAQDRLDGATLDFASVLPQVELRFLARVGDAYKTVDSPLLNANPADDIFSLPQDMVSARVDQAPLLWPDASPQTIAFCANARPGRIACASLPLTDFLALSAGCGEADRNAQTHYLRHMAQAVSGPAMHVQAVVDLLTRQFGVSGNPEVKRLLNLAAAEARRLSEVVRGSLELMKLRSAHVQDRLHATRVDGLVKEVADAVAAREGAHRDQVVTVEGASDRQVMVHTPSLISMLNIVLTNAMRYSPPGGLIEVRLRAEERALHVEVEDSGPGMKPEELSRLGEPFFRGVSSIGVQGSGLGIATCLELANHTNSSVTFARSSNPEKGLLVNIILPWSK